MVQIRTLGALEDIIDICATCAACYRCPFRRITAHAIQKYEIYKAADICALYDVFGKIPRTIETERLRTLFEEGRIDDEVLYKEDGEGSDAGRRAEDQTDQAADHGERDTARPESDH